MEKRCIYKLYKFNLIILIISFASTSLKESANSKVCKFGISIVNQIKIEILSIWILDTKQKEAPADVKAVNDGQSNQITIL